MALSHSQLCELAAAFLRDSMQCKVVLIEPWRMTGEQPDVIGWDERGNSFLIECKTSRADFEADKDKPWRADAVGIGQQRYYLCDVSIVQEIQDAMTSHHRAWGLLEVVNGSVHERFGGGPSQANFKLERLLLVRAWIKSEKQAIQPKKQPKKLDAELAGWLQAIEGYVETYGLVLASDAVKRCALERPTRHRTVSAAVDAIGRHQKYLTRTRVVARGGLLYLEPKQ